MNREDEIYEVMRDVIDPELGINIVDLGLLYGVREEDGETVLEMTLTSAACPLTDVIEDQVQAALQGVAEKHRIEWVWTPPWDLTKITDDGREMLRSLGFRA